HISTITSFLQYSPHHRDLHSFPTRRSSDLERPAANRRPRRVFPGRRQDLQDSVVRARPLRGSPGEQSPLRRAAWPAGRDPHRRRSEEHTSELQSRFDLVCRLLLEKKKNLRV